MSYYSPDHKAVTVGIRFAVLFIILATNIDHGDSMAVPSSFGPTTSEKFSIYTEVYTDISSLEIKPVATNVAWTTPTATPTLPFTTSEEFLTSTTQSEPRANDAKKTTAALQTTIKKTTADPNTTADKKTANPKTTAKLTTAQTTTEKTTADSKTAAKKTTADPKTTAMMTTTASKTTAKMTTSAQSTSKILTTADSKTTAKLTTADPKTTAKLTTAVPATTNKKTTPLPKTTAKSTRTTAESMTTDSPEMINKFKFTQNGKICILENMNAWFGLDVKDKKPLGINMTDAVVDNTRSQCGDKKSKKAAILTVLWDSPFGYNNSFTQKFSVDGDHYYLSSYNLTLKRNGSNKPTTIYTTVVGKDYLRTSFGKSVICHSPPNLTYTNGSVSLTGVLSDVKLQAFDVEKTFSEGYNCSSSSSGTLYIVVAVVASVIVITVIGLAYFVYRRKTEHARAGYETM